MSELHKARVTDVSEAQKIALSNEVFVKEQLKQALEEHQLNSKRMQSDLITQVIMYMINVYRSIVMLGPTIFLGVRDVNMFLPEGPMMHIQLFACHFREQFYCRYHFCSVRF